MCMFHCRAWSCTDVTSCDGLCMTLHHLDWLINQVEFLLLVWRTRRNLCVTMNTTIRCVWVKGQGYLNKHTLLLHHYRRPKRASAWCFWPTWMQLSIWHTHMLLLASIEASFRQSPTGERRSVSSLGKELSLHSRHEHKVIPTTMCQSCDNLVTMFWQYQLQNHLVVTMF